MKNIIFALFTISAMAGIVASCGSSGTARDESTKSEAKVSASEKATKPEYLTAATFKEKVWDYTSNPDEWVFNGELPCIIDFYADWCKPCRMIAPIMEELAVIYEGRVNIYKVDTEKERELASVFQIRSIPAILFSPEKGQPAMQTGAMTKEQYIQIIDEFVLGIKNEPVNN